MIARTFGGDNYEEYIIVDKEYFKVLCCERVPADDANLASSTANVHLVFSYVKAHYGESYNDVAAVIPMEKLFSFP